MTGTVTMAGLIGVLSLLAGIVLGWYLRRTNERCPTCGEGLICEHCRRAADLPHRSTTRSSHP